MKELLKTLMYETLVIKKDSTGLLNIDGVRSSADYVSINTYGQVYVHYSDDNHIIPSDGGGFLLIDGDHPLPVPDNVMITQLEINRDIIHGEYYFRISGRVKDRQTFSTCIASGIPLLEIYQRIQLFLSELSKSTLP